MTKLKEKSFSEIIEEGQKLKQKVELYYEQSKLFTDCSEALEYASKNGNAESVKLLISGSEQNFNGKSLILASVNGHAECVKLLILSSDLKSNSGEALFFASYRGHAECVKLLIAVSDPEYNNGEALRWASENGHTECVKLLLPLSKTKDVNSLALLHASKNCHAECVELLLPHSDISAWGEKEWKIILPDMQNIIKIYFSEMSLTKNVLPSNSQILKIKKYNN